MSGVLQQIADGNAAAVEDCLDLYGGLVWSIARRFSSTNAQAEEAVQEIFLHLWQQASRFDPGKGSEKALVAMPARRRMIDQLRRLEKRVYQPTLFAVSVEQPGGVIVTDRSRIALLAQRQP